MEDSAQGNQRGRGNYRGNNYIEGYRPRARPRGESNYRPRYNSNSDRGESTYRPRYSSNSDRGSTNYRSNRYNNDDTSNSSYRGSRYNNEDTSNSNYRGSRYSNDDGFQRPRSRYNSGDDASRSNYRPRASRYNDETSSQRGSRYSDSGSYQPRSRNTYSSDNNSTSRGSRYTTREYEPRGSSNYRGRNQLQGTSDLIHVFQSIVAQRYRQDINCLDLNNLSQDSLVNQRQIKFFDSQSNAMPALVKYLCDHLPNLLSLNLEANPSLTNTACLHSLGNLSHLKNLSLQGSGIRFYTDLDHMDGSNIQNLILKDSPLYTSEMSKGGSYYQDEILKRFPALKELDGAPVKGIEFDVPRTDFEKVVLPNFLVDKDKAFRFVGDYFGAFDTNRSVLQQAYTPDAFFSVQLNKPRSSPMSDYAQYSQISRNMKFTKDSQKRFNSLFYGNEIGPALMMLPGTIHSFLTDETKILFDFYPTENTGHVLVIHSDFQDLSTNLVLGFDRVFLLNNDMKIKSDMLTIRESLTLPLTKPVDLNLQQYQLVLEFIKGTGMNFGYSLLCLRECNFNFEDAKQAFLNAKQSGALPESAMSIE
eukprot:NODE_113_length_18482_cov_1.630746.p2 type:complete len:588 gc:universal NODE_113_length_18482_cov_1.630746:10854-9091(-)